MDERESLRSLRSEVLMSLLALASVAMVVYEVVAELKPHQRLVFERADLGIAVVFLADFAWRLAKSSDRRTFFKRSWWELIAAIPITAETARMLRALRLIRLVMVVRLLRIVRVAAQMQSLMRQVRLFEEKTSVIKLTIVMIATLLCGALAFHYFEFGLNPNVKSFGDSVWWSIVTISTIGYGDIFPVTTVGRVIAAFMMLFGLGTFGVYTASIASWVMRKE